MGGEAASVSVRRHQKPYLLGAASRNNGMLDKTLPGIISTRIKRRNHAQKDMSWPSDLCAGVLFECVGTRGNGRYRRNGEGPAGRRHRRSDRGGNGYDDDREENADYGCSRVLPV